MNRVLGNQTEDTLDLIEEIFEKGTCWVMDFLPKQCKNIEQMNILDIYLLKKKNKKKFAEKLINVLFKIMPYYDVEIYVPETPQKSLKKYSGHYLKKDMKLTKLERIMKKIIINDATITVLLRPIMAVIEFEAYNTGVYLQEQEDTTFFKQIVESEGLFFWKSPT